MRPNSQLCYITYKLEYMGIGKPPRESMEINEFDGEQGPISIGELKKLASKSEIMMDLITRYQNDLESK